MADQILTPINKSMLICPQDRTIGYTVEATVSYLEPPIDPPGGPPSNLPTLITLEMVHPWASGLIHSSNFRFVLLVETDDPQSIVILDPYASGDSLNPPVISRPSVSFSPTLIARQGMLRVWANFYLLGSDDLATQVPAALSGPLLLEMPFSNALPGLPFLLLTVTWKAIPVSSIRKRQTPWNKTAAEWLELGRRFAPHVHYTKQELYQPSSVDSFYFDASGRVDLEYNGKPLIEAVTSWESIAASPAVRLSFTSLAEPSSSTELPPKAKKDHWRFAVRNKEHTYHGDYAQRECYLHVKTYAQSEVADLQYWFFYAYNGKSRASQPSQDPDHTPGSGGQHEADWEHVTIRLLSEVRVIGVYLSIHSGGRYFAGGLNGFERFLHNKLGRFSPILYFPLSDVDHLDGHPQVFAAAETHAFYQDTGSQIVPAGTTDLLGLPLPLTLNDYTDDDGKLWKVEEPNDVGRLSLTWLGHTEIGSGRTTGAKPWTWFLGRWGREGPTGPGLKEVFYSDYDFPEK